MSESKNYFTYRLQQSLKTRWTLFKDWLDVVLGNRHVLTPPKRYDSINIGDHTAIAKEFFAYFTLLGGLMPHHKVLEAGSGFGRMAIPLTTFLSGEGSYTGIEIIKDGVNWCQSHFTPNYPHFNFQHIAVYNERYNPKGTVMASVLKFPFEDHSFDFVYLTSVFTHMFADDVENYLSEIARVLKSNGRCLITYFILNESSQALIEAQQSIFTFKNQSENCYIEDLSKPEYAVAYNELFIKRLYKKNNLSIDGNFHYGSWSGLQDSLSFQDVVIAVKNV